MRDLTWKINIKNKYTTLYLMFIFCISFCKSIGMASESSIYQVVFGGGMLIVLLKVLHERFTRRELSWLLIFGVIIVINAVITHKVTLLFTYVILLGVKNVDLSAVFKVMLITRILGMASVILLTWTGLIDARSIMFWRNNQMILRSALGYDHPNLLHTLFLGLIILIIYFTYQKINIWGIGILFALNYGLYQFSYSRTGFYCVNLLLIITLLSKVRCIQKVLFKLAVYIQFILMAFTLLICTVFWPTNFVQHLNQLLTGRVYYSMLQFYYRIPLFGRNFQDVHLNFDNSYSMILTMYGLIITVVFLYGYYRVAREVERQQNIVLCIIFIILSVAMFLESYLPNTLLNLTLFYMAKYFYHEDVAFVNRRAAR